MTISASFILQLRSADFSYVLVVVLEHEVVVDELLVLRGGHGLQGVVLALQLPLQGLQGLDGLVFHFLALLQNTTKTHITCSCIATKYDENT